jgi:hypothetical protein
MKNTFAAFAFLCASSLCCADSSSAPQHWAVVPILISNAETGIQGGMLVMRFLNPEDTSNKPSSLGFAVRVSQKLQTQIDLFPEWYLGHNLYHINANLHIIRWPADYYGIGNGTDIPKDSANPYLAQGFNGDVSLERQLLPGLFIGPQALFNYEQVRFTGNENLVDSGMLGKTGGFVSGLGGVMTYDRRDAIYWARKGCFLRAKAAWYRSAWGSDFDYDSYSLEARQFFPVFQTSALGFAATLQLKSGDVPFRELSSPDGDHMMRGMVRGKYRDRHMLVLQSEYKSTLPNWGFFNHPLLRDRLGWVVFTEAGQVAHEVGDFAWNEFRQGYGFGFRYAMNKSQRMNIRGDLGFVDGTIAPAINIKEAF